MDLNVLNKSHEPQDYVDLPFLLREVVSAHLYWPVSFTCFSKFWDTYNVF